MPNDMEEMCRLHFNEPMISFHEIARCIGYGETALDCYIITRHIGGKIVWNTCVGGYTFLDRLKGQEHVVSTEGENWDDFTRLDSSLALNGCPREESFLLDVRLDDFEGRRKD